MGNDSEDHKSVFGNIKDHSRMMQGFLQKGDDCMRVRKRIGAWSLVIALLFALLPQMQMSIQAAQTTPLGVHGRLSVKGADLMDAKGNKVQLRGISTHGINWDVGYPYVKKEAFQTLRDDWGANAVRLAMYTSDYNGYCSGGDKKALRNRIYQGVRYATELGMYVIIDWHILNDGNPKQNQAQAKSFFSIMSKKYKNQKNVIYEICNEPNGCDWKTIKSYATSVIQTIRSNDKNAIIIVGTPTWSQLGSDGTHHEVANGPITGYKNLMYALHFYANESSHNKYLPDKLAYARKKKLPVIVSEFGLSKAGGNGGISTTSMEKWFTRLDKSNISYFCWSLSNKKESCSLLSSKTKKTSGWKTTDLSSAGKFVRTKYRARKQTLGKKA